jgi:glycosyltransferase involved in cell wall biosynthesis
LIKETLPSLFNQNVSQDDYNVIIVDNNSTDQTTEFLEQIPKKYNNVTIVFEKKQGLSHAKNAGMMHTKTEWIVYLDDDAKVPFDFVSKAQKNIVNSKFKCFGGVYLPWYKYGKPKWYKDEYVSNKDKLLEFNTLNKDYISGGIFAINKNLLMQYNGFSTNIGMKGDNVSYGEETLLQIKIRKDDYEIGYDPNWLIYHIVAKYKLSPWWFLKNGYVSGRDSWIIYTDNPSTKKLFLYFYRSIKLFFINLYKYTKKIINSDYYMQNWIIDVLRPTVLKYGQIVGGVKILLMKNANK